MIDRLHAENVGAFIELPQIAVMGDTSSGKSSLLSAIAGIQFPSSENLSTRCPMRLRMENTNKRGASAELRYVATVSIKWHPSSTYAENATFETVKLESLSGIPLAVADAQKFILSTSGRQVARDIVEIGVWGPDLTDLTLIDLPGIVRTVGTGEDESIISDINELIKEFLMNERCIILAIVPANVEYHNSQILQEAKRVDPGTKRTVGVITKPDMIDECAEGSVLQLLMGEKWAMDHGFHMVKCRGQKGHNERKTLEHERVEEINFFRTRDPWARMEDRSKFGIEALRSKLSNIQVNMIEDSVPKIIDEVERRSEFVQSKLAQLGSDFDNDFKRRSYFEGIKSQALAVVEGCTGVGSAIGGADKLGTNGNTWATSLNLALDKFKTAVSTSKLAALDHIGVDTVVDISQITGKAGQLGKILEFKSGNILLEYYPPESCPKPPLQERGVDQRWKFVSFPISSIKASNHWLRDIMERNRNYDLPCFLNAQVFSLVVRELVTHDWTPACDELLLSLFELIDNMASLLDIPRFPLLQVHFRTAFRDAAKSFESSVREEIAKQLEKDTKSRPYTQNQYLFEAIARKRHENTVKRVEGIVGTYKGSSGASSWEDERKAALGVIDALVQTLTMQQDHHVFDHMVNEMEIVVEAYGKVASRRVIDEVPRIIFLSLGSFCSNLRDSLRASDQELARFMQDKPDIRDRRKRAMAELEAMERAKSVFLSLH